jgi:hypothetical protein
VRNNTGDAHWLRQTLAAERNDHALSTLVSRQVERWRE